MAGFQALGLPTTFTSSQSNPHHFRSLHRQTQDQRPSEAASAGGIVTDDRRASAESSGFSRVRVPSTGIRDMTTSGSLGRRHSDDSSSCLRSEWVTLSKAMLMVLVEKICQLSFENEPSPGTHSDLRGGGSGGGGGSSSALPVVHSSKDGTTVAMPRKSLNNDGGGVVGGDCGGGGDGSTPAPCDTSTPTPPHHQRSPSVTASGVDPEDRPSSSSPDPLALLSPAASPPDDRLNISNSCPLSPGIEPSQPDAPSVTLNDTSDPDVTGLRSDAVEHHFNRTQDRDTRSNWIRRRSSKRNHQRLMTSGRVARTGKGSVGGGGGGGDERRVSAADESIRKPKVKPLRQHPNLQPWIACNKTLVYSMIDSALGATSSSDIIKQVSVVTKPRPKAAVGSDPIVKDTTGSERTAHGGAANKDGCAKASRITDQPKPNCEAPLLGALLSYDDITTDDLTHPVPSLPTPGVVRSSVPSRTQTSAWHKTLFSGDQQNPRSCHGQFADLHPSETDIGGCSARSSTEMRCRRSFDEGGQRSPRSDAEAEAATVEPDGDSDSRLRSRGRRRFGSEGEWRPLDFPRQTPASRPGNDLARPLWIALDKSEVCSLVDSLVSTMMMTTTGDDVSRQTSVRCRSGLSPSNVAPNSNADVDCVSATTGCHSNDSERCHSGNQDDNDDDVTAVDYSRANTASADHHGSGAMDTGVGDHGNGAKACRLKHGIQCLLVEDGDRVSGRPVGTFQRQDSRSNPGEGSKSNLKWKSTMMQRLHSQSQDGETG